MDKTEFIKLIKRTKRYYDKAQKSEQELFDFLEDSYPYIDLEDIPSQAENADSIKDAVTCYCQYGEYTPEKIYEELKQIDI